MLVLLLLSIYCYFANAVQKCCEGKNSYLLINRTCSDGSNFTTLKCEVKVFLGPQEYPPTSIETDNDGMLIVTDEDNVEYYKIEPQNYCLTKNAENEAEAAIICVQEQMKVYPTAKVMSLIFVKATCGFISASFFLAGFLIYLLVPTLLDLEGKCSLNLLFFLTGAHIIIIAIPMIRYFDPLACISTDFLYYTLMLYAYNWLSVMCFHMWRISSKYEFRKKINWLLVYCAYGYGLPLFLLVVALIIHYSVKHSVEEEEPGCWVDGSVAVWGYFYGPTMVMLLLAIIALYLVATNIWTGFSLRNCTPHDRRLRKKSLVYMHLVLVLGVRKITDIITYVYLENHTYLNYLWQISSCRNILTGGAIFFILTVQRHRVRIALAKYGFLCLKFPEGWNSLIDKESEEYERTKLLQTTRL